MKKKITLAIVDDEALFRMGVILLLDIFKTFELLWEGDNGEELLTHLETTSIFPDIVLIDIKTETWEGIENARLLVNKYPSIKFVVLSSYFSKEFVIHMLEIGAAAYLPKKSRLEELHETLKTVMEKGYHYSPAVKKLIREKLAGKKQKALPTVNPNLSKREVEVLKLICEQYTNQEIAEQLQVSIRTIEWHRNNLLQKLNCKNTAGLVVLAIQQGWVEVKTSDFWKKKEPSKNTGFRKTRLNTVFWLASIPEIYTMNSFIRKTKKYVRWRKTKELV